MASAREIYGASDTGQTGMSQQQDSQSKVCGGSYCYRPQRQDHKLSELQHLRRCGADEQDDQEMIAHALR